MRHILCAEVMSHVQVLSIEMTRPWRRIVCTANSFLSSLDYNLGQVHTPACVYRTSNEEYRFSGQPRSVLGAKGGFLVANKMAQIEMIPFGWHRHRVHVGKLIWEKLVLFPNGCCRCRRPSPYQSTEIRIDAWKWHVPICAIRKLIILFIETLFALFSYSFFYSFAEKKQHFSIYLFNIIITFYICLFILTLRLYLAMLLCSFRCPHMVRQSHKWQRNIVYFMNAILFSGFTSHDSIHLVGWFRINGIHINTDPRGIYMSTKQLLNSLQFCAFKHYFLQFHNLV